MLCELLGSRRLGLCTPILVLRLTEDAISVRFYWLVDVGLETAEQDDSEILRLKCNFVVGSISTSRIKDFTRIVVDAPRVKL